MQIENEWAYRYETRDFLGKLEKSLHVLWGEDNIKILQLQFLNNRNLSEGVVSSYEVST